MFITSLVLTTLLTLATATPTSRLQARQQSQQVSISISVSNAQFASFENSNTLKSYLQSQGYNYNFNYPQLSSVVQETENYFANEAASTDGTTNAFAPPNNNAIMTDSHSTSLKNGPSYTNVTATANTNLVSVFPFSDGNAASSGGAIQRTQTSSSDASSGAANSTDHVTGGANDNSIVLSAMVASASTSVDVEGGPKDALAGGVCAADATGASASAQVVTTVTIPVGTSGQATSGSVSTAFCESGVAARDSGAASGSGTSTGMSKAALTDGGVSVSVTCDGQTTNGPAATVGWTVNVKGTMSGSNFVGTLIAVRTASVQVSCS